MSYDCIVLGTGGVGSAALHHLAKRGVNVLGIDRFPPAHDRGSSHGETRAIRLAYFEHPDYVPILRRAYDLWEDLQAARGESLYVECGILELGPADGDVVPGVLEAAQRHQLEIETLSASEAAARFPGLLVPDDVVGVFEKRAGFLRVEACVRAHIDAAVESGAALQTDETVLNWAAEGSGVVVETDRGRYHAGRLVLTAGAWAPDFLAALNVPLRVLRKTLVWYSTRTRDYLLERGFPVWFYESPLGNIYGFPEIDEMGFKLAQHDGGTEVADPLLPDRELLEADRRPLEALLQAHFPGVTQRPAHHAVCMYTMSPDSHFIVDRHPGAPQVSFVAGLSGHGFKMANALGEAVADLALDGTSPLPIEFLGLSRLLAGS